MSMVILLDAGPLGLITNPRASSENAQLQPLVNCSAFLYCKVKDREYCSPLASSTINTQRPVVFSECPIRGSVAHCDSDPDSAFCRSRPGGKCSAGCLSRLAHNGYLYRLVVHAANSGNALRSYAWRFWPAASLYRYWRAAAAH